MSQLSASAVRVEPTSLCQDPELGKASTQQGREWFKRFVCCVWFLAGRSEGCARTEPAPAAAQLGLGTWMPMQGLLLASSVVGERGGELQLHTAKPKLS